MATRAASRQPATTPTDVSTSPPQDRRAARPTRVVPMPRAHTRGQFYFITPLRLDTAGFVPRPVDLALRCRPTSSRFGGQGTAALRTTVATSLSKGRVVVVSARTAQTSAKQHIQPAPAEHRRSPRIIIPPPSGRRGPRRALPVRQAAGPAGQQATVRGLYGSADRLGKGLAWVVHIATPKYTI